MLKGVKQFIRIIKNVNKKILPSKQYNNLVLVFIFNF